MSDESKTQAEIENDEKCNNIIAKMQEEESSLRSIGQYEVKEEEEESEEINNEKDEEVIEESEEVKEDKVDEEPQYTEEELDAISKGWKSQSQYEGNPSQFRSAKEFLEKKELLDLIRKQNKRLKKIEDDKVREEARILLNRKREAIKNSDIEAAEQYEKAYYELYNPEQFEEIKNQSEMRAAKEFAHKNSDWFNNYEENVAENEEMTKFAIQHDNYLISLYPELTDAERLGKVEKAVKSKYSSRFGLSKPARQKAAAVNIPTSPQMKKDIASNDKITYNELSFEIKQEINEFLPHLNESYPSNPYTKESYVENLVKNGIIKKEKGKIIYG